MQQLDRPRQRVDGGARSRPGTQIILGKQLAAGILRAEAAPFGQDLIHSTITKAVYKTHPAKQKTDHMTHTHAMATTTPN
jgi:hypothetical protein